MIQNTARIDDHKSHYAMFPNNLIDSGALAVMSPIEAKVFLVIARGCSNKRRICRYTIEHIIEKVGHHKNVVYQAIKGLGALGVVKTWRYNDKNTDKIRGKRYFQINWEVYSLSETMRRKHTKASNKLSLQKKNNLTPKESSIICTTA